jgi:hypothetical protein
MAPGRAADVERRAVACVPRALYCAVQSAARMQRPQRLFQPNDANVRLRSYRSFRSCAVHGNTV